MTRTTPLDPERSPLSGRRRCASLASRRLDYSIVRLADPTRTLKVVAAYCAEIEPSASRLSAGVTTNTSAASPGQVRGTAAWSRDYSGSVPLLVKAAVSRCCAVLFPWTLDTCTVGGPSQALVCAPCSGRSTTPCAHGVAYLAPPMDGDESRYPDRCGKHGGRAA